MRVLNRREFNELCVALGSFVASSDVSAVEPASGTASSGANRTVKFPTGAVVPALGQSSAGLGQGRHPAAEEEALRTGLSLGMMLIDTSGDYGDGRSEELIKRVIAGQRDRAFVVSKVEANQVTGNATRGSLRDESGPRPFPHQKATDRKSNHLRTIRSSEIVPSQEASAKQAQHTPETRSKTDLPES